VDHAEHDHNEFFRLEIDPDDEPTKEERAWIEQHRLECADCRELEKSHRQLTGPRVISKHLPPPTDGERVRKSAEAVARARRSGPPWRFLGGLLLGCLLASAAWGLRGQALSPPEKAAPTNPFDGTELPPKEQILRGDKGLPHVKGTEPSVPTSKKLLLESAVARFHVLARSPENAVVAHLGIAECLLCLDRNKEAKAEAQAVLDDPRATEDQKRDARGILLAHD